MTAALPKETAEDLTDAQKQEQMVEWLETLLAYAKGEREWDTGGAWVDESNPLMPFEMGYYFDTKTAGPGMPPFTPR